MLKQGIDYAEKHAGTVRWDSLKMLIAIAVMKGFDIVLYNISSFYLYRKLAEGCEMYVNIPEGWEGNDDEGRKPDDDNVWKLEALGGPMHHTRRRRYSVRPSPKTPHFNLPQPMIAFILLAITRLGIVPLAHT